MSLKTFSLLLSLVVASTAGALRPSARMPSSQVYNFNRAASQAANGTPPTASSVLAPAASNAVPQASDDFDCNTDSATPFLRAHSLVHTDHFYTTDYKEMEDAVESGDYEYQGIAGLVLRNPTQSTVPLYAVYHPGSKSSYFEHYYTTSQQEADTCISKEGYVDQGTAANVYATQICGSIPLYYVWIPNKDSLYTTNETEREYAIKTLGYKDEGIACYVLPELLSTRPGLHLADNQHLSGTVIAVEMATLGESSPAATPPQFKSAPPSVEVQVNLDTASAVPFVRAYSATLTDHFYTTNYAEMKAVTLSGTYTLEKTMGFVFRTPAPSTTPLYRLYSLGATDHFYTTSQTEANFVILNGGYGTEGTGAYVYATQVGGSIPLYRLFSPSALDNFYTTDEAEREDAVQKLGYTDLGIACYVLQNL
ncbi:hypothetical protein FOMPIDRAFT_1054665 [Fomitopsis schrenkii]|uniref:DUF5648 domain-containing protein n=1 Tax=Fomitopsis schrenkii TaxID=2126942 RepID=S8DUJ4_FOMSC|nr:hypothetical protein FOMPIDRAFT_1054665 [Fomitopsis schrenkii]